MKSFNINKNFSTVLFGYRLPNGCIYGLTQDNDQMTYYICECLTQYADGWLYVKKYDHKRKRWFEKPDNGEIAQHILSVCEKHGITKLNIEHYTTNAKQCAGMMNDSIRKQKITTLKEVGKRHWKRGDSNDFERKPVFRVRTDKQGIQHLTHVGHSEMEFADRVSGTIVYQ